MSTTIITTKRIGEINQDGAPFVVVGVIVAKSDPKYFQGTATGGGGGQRQAMEPPLASIARGVMTLTLRDSDRDTVNCTVWGTAATICTYDELFKVGEVIDVTRPKVSSVYFDRSEQYAPKVSSSYCLTVDDREESSIQLHEGAQLERMKVLTTVPAGRVEDTLQLADIVGGGSKAGGENVNVLVVVRSIRPRKEVSIVRTRQVKAMREVIVMDQSHPGVCLKLWNKEYVDRADRWVPLTTVLMIVDARIDYNQYYKSIGLGLSGRTVITEDPAIPQADRLLLHVMQLPMKDVDVACSLSSGIVDPATITTVMTVQQIFDRAEGDSMEENDQFTALCYAVITRMDLDGHSKLVSRKCLHCKGLLRSQDSSCMGEECIARPANFITFFDIPLDVTDHTGTLSSCRLVSDVAEKTLGCKVEEFQNMTDSQRGKLKWKLLLERCVVKLVIKRRSVVRFQNLFSVVECTLADPEEVEAKIRVY